MSGIKLEIFYLMRIKIKINLYTFLDKLYLVELFSWRRKFLYEKLLRMVVTADHEVVDWKFLHVKKTW